MIRRGSVFGKTRTRACAAYTTLGRHSAGGRGAAERRRSRGGGGGRLNNRGHPLREPRARVSRPIFPFIGPMQRRFFKTQLDGVEAACLSRLLHTTATLRFFYHPTLGP